MLLSTFRNVFAILVGITLLFSCSPQRTAGGGGTEIGNAEAVVGTICSRDGTPAASTQIILVDSSFNPHVDTPAGRCYLDTTDIKGNFLFENIPHGTYSIEAKSLLDGTRLLQTGLHISGDTCVAKSDTLKLPGVLEIIDTSSHKDLWLIVPGTTIDRHFAGAGDTIIIDSLPADLLPQIWIITSNGSTQQTDTLSGSIAPAEGATTIITTTTKWTLLPDVDSTGIKDVVSLSVVSDCIYRLCALPDSNSTAFITSSGITTRIIDSTNAIMGKTALPYGITFSSYPSYLWLATQGGVGYVSGSSLVDFAPRSISSRAPDSLRGDFFCDRNSNVWIAYNDGKTSRWTYYVWKDYNISSPHAIYVDGGADSLTPDTIWAASTDSGLVKVIDSVQTVFNTGNSPLVDLRINSLAGDTSGNLWMATPHGLYRFDKKTVWDHYSTENSPLPIDNVRKAVVDSSNAVWASYGVAGDPACGVLRYGNGSWTVYDCSKLPGFVTGANYISDIAFDRTTKAIWIAVWGLGLFKLSE